MGGGEGSDLAKLSPFENVGLGVAAGTVEVCTLQPMLYCKNAVQQGLPFTLNPRILYRGLLMSVTNMSILTGAQFPLTGAVSRVFTRGQERKLSSAEQVGAGFLGGALSGVVCAPMELVMIQQQRNGGSLFFQAGRVLSEHGPSTLFRGLATSCGREGMFTAGCLGLAPVLAEKLHSDFGVESKLGSFLGACCAGIVAATLSHPLDTIKTCLQGDVAQKKYKSMPETYSTLMKEGGVGRFFTGWGWRTGRMICAIFIMGQCKDRFAPIFYPHHFRKGGDRA
jgi:solute carrier family 25 carnitine/acylcarnitine transporter 20/29